MNLGKILYSSNLFIFAKAKYLVAFCSQISIRDRESIRKVRLDVLVDRHHIDRSLEPANLLLGLPGLRQIVVRMCVGDRNRFPAQTENRLQEEMTGSTTFPKLNLAVIMLVYYGSRTEARVIRRGFQPVRCFEVVADTLGLTLPQSSDEADDSDEQPGALD